MGSTTGGLTGLPRRTTQQDSWRKARLLSSFQNTEVCGQQSTAETCTPRRVPSSVKLTPSHTVAERYLREVWPVITKALKEVGIKCELNLVSMCWTNMTVCRARHPESRSLITKNLSV